MALFLHASTDFGVAGASELLWSLRNRLIVAYIFIAFVPIILLLVLAVLAAQIIYSQLGAYLLSMKIFKHRVEMHIGISR